MHRRRMLGRDVGSSCQVGSPGRTFEPAVAFLVRTPDLHSAAAFRPLQVDAELPISP
jgi:hypothetical protein